MTERRYIVVNNQPKCRTIHLEIKGARVRVTLDGTKWEVSHHLADSGSSIVILLSPKESSQLKGEQQ